MCEIKSMPYEECRAEHFKALMKKMQRKIDWWQNKKWHALGPVTMISRANIECCEAGTQYNFYKDALEALEDNKFQYETGFVKGFEAAQPKWSSVEEPPKHTCDYLVYVWVAYPDGISHMQTRTGVYNIVRKEWTIPHDQSEVVGEPKYWMQLPEPPKEDNDA